MDVSGILDLLNDARRGVETAAAGRVLALAGAGRGKTRVLVHHGALVDVSIRFHGVVLGEGAHPRNCLLDKAVEVPARAQIGMDLSRDRERFVVTDRGSP